MKAETARDWIDLAERAGDGLDVRLWWSPATGAVKVAVDRTSTGQRGELWVRPEHALDAFYHPFAYAGSSREIVRVPGHEPAASVAGGE